MHRLESSLQDCIGMAWHGTWYLAVILFFSEACGLWNLEQHLNLQVWQYTIIHEMQCDSFNWHGTGLASGVGGKGRLKGRMILIHQKVSRAVAARRCHSLHSQPQHSQSRFFFQVVNGTGFWNRTIPRFWQCFWGQSLVLEPQKRVHVWFLAFTGVWWLGAGVRSLFHA